MSTNIQEFWITVRNYKSIVNEIAVINTKLFLSFSEFDYKTYDIQTNFAFGLINPLYVTPAPSQNYIRIYGVLVHPIPYVYDPVQGSVILKILLKPLTDLWSLPSLWEQSIIRTKKGQAIPAIVSAWNSPINSIEVPEFRVIPYPIPKRLTNET